MAGSSIPGRSVILSSHGDNESLAASWGSHIWQSHRDVGRLLGASKVSRVLGGMAGRSWTFIRPPAKTWRGTWRANQRDMLANTPCRTVWLLATPCGAHDELG